MMSALGSPVDVGYATGGPVFKASTKRSEIVGQCRYNVCRVAPVRRDNSLYVTAVAPRSASSSLVSVNTRVLVRVTRTSTIG